MYLLALRNGTESSSLVVHWKEYHPNSDWSYGMKIVGTHKTPLPRQVHEGQLIGEYSGHRIINRKGEWGENLPPKLVLEDQEQHGDSNDPQAQNQGQNQDTKKRNGGRDQLQQTGAKRQRVDGEMSEKGLGTRSKIPLILRSEAVALKDKGRHSLENSLGDDLGKVRLVSGEEKGGQFGNTSVDEGKDKMGIRVLGESGVKGSRGQPRGEDKSQNQHGKVILPDSKLEYRRSKPPEEDPGTILDNTGF